MSVKVDAAALKALKGRIERMEAGTRGLAEAAIKDVAAEALTRIESMTPRDTGNLVRRWTDRTTPPGEPAKSVSNEAWRDASPVEWTGKTGTLTISNSAEYALYVDKGHRTPNHKGWVPGVFMLERGLKQTEPMVSGIVEKRLKAFLEGK